MHLNQRNSHQNTMISDAFKVNSKPNPLLTMELGKIIQGFEPLKRIFLT